MFINVNLVITLYLPLEYQPPNVINCLVNVHTCWLDYVRLGTREPYGLHLPAVTEASYKKRGEVVIINL